MWHTSKFSDVSRSKDWNIKESLLSGGIPSNMTATGLQQLQVTNDKSTNKLIQIVSEWLSLTAIFGTEDIGVHIVHASRVIITYTLEWLSPLT